LMVVIAVGVVGINVVAVMWEVVVVVVAIESDVDLTTGFLVAFSGGAPDLAALEVLFEAAEALGVFAELEEDVVGVESRSAALRGEVSGCDNLWRG